MFSIGIPPVLNITSSANNPLLNIAFSTIKHKSALLNITSSAKHRFLQTLLKHHLQIKNFIKVNFDTNGTP